MFSIYRRRNDFGKLLYYFMYVSMPCAYITLNNVIKNPFVIFIDWVNAHADPAKKKLREGEICFHDNIFLRRYLTVFNVTPPTQSATIMCNGRNNY